MSAVLADEIVMTDYGQFDLIWAPKGGFDGNFSHFFADQVNGLVGAADPSGVYVNLARRSGGSVVRVVLHDIPPAPDAEWEDIVEVSTTIPTDASPRMCTWAGERTTALDGLTPGTYRLRVSATGRDAGREGEFAESVVDRYLVELWPEPEVRADEVVRVGSADAEYWHRECGGQRYKAVRRHVGAVVTPELAPRLGMPPVPVRRPDPRQPEHG